MDDHRLLHPFCAISGVYQDQRRPAAPEKRKKKKSFITTELLTGESGEEKLRRERKRLAHAHYPALPARLPTIIFQHAMPCLALAARHQRALGWRFLRCAPALPAGLLALLYTTLPAKTAHCLKTPAARCCCCCAGIRSAQQKAPPPPPYRRFARAGSKNRREIPVYTATYAYFRYQKAKTKRGAAASAEKQKLFVLYHTHSVSDRFFFLFYGWDGLVGSGSVQFGSNVMERLAIISLARARLKQALHLSSHSLLLKNMYI